MHGLLPTCVLEAPCAQQSWEVEVGVDPPNKNHPPTVLRMGRAVDTGRISGALVESNSLFDLDTRTELALEYRRAAELGDSAVAANGGAAATWGVWHGVIRGLEPSQAYTVRVRSVLADPWQMAGTCTPTTHGGDAIGGVWSASLKTRTRRVASPSLSWWDTDTWLLGSGGAAAAVNGGRLEIGRGPLSSRIRCKLKRRWVRIRPPHGDGSQAEATAGRGGLRSGTDVLWRLSVQKLSWAPWRVSIFREGTLPLAVEGDGRACDASTAEIGGGSASASGGGGGGGRGRQRTAPAPARPVPFEVITGAGLELCGRIHADRGEVIRLEWEAAPSGPGDERADEIECSWRALSSSSDIEVAQRTSANPRAAESKGRYLRIDHKGKHICITDICVYDYNGCKIVPVGIAASSVLSDDTDCYPAAHAIDGQLSTFCCTGGIGPQWLRLDFGAQVSVGCIEIVNRLDQNPRLGISRLSCAIITLTEDLEATERVWTTQILQDQLIYRFVFQHHSQAKALEPSAPPALVGEELETALEDYPEPDFAKLERLVEGILESHEELPSRWHPLDGEWEVDIPGAAMPFSGGGRPAGGAQQAVEGKVVKTFNSHARPHWLKLRNRGGGEVDAVFKRGDDLRQDQLVIGMLQLFNRIWKEEGVTHIALGGTTVPVEHPIYAVAAVGTDRGLVQMLPNSEPVDQIVANEKRANNGWRATNEMIPSAVATFIGQRLPPS